MKIAKDFPEIGNKLLDLHYGVEIAKITDKEYLDFARDFLYNLMIEPETLSSARPKLFTLLKLMGRIEDPPITDSFKASLSVARKMIEFAVKNEYSKLEEEFKEMERESGTGSLTSSTLPGRANTEIIGYNLAYLMQRLIEMYMRMTEKETSAVNLTKVRVELDKIIKDVIIDPKKPSLPGFSKDTYWSDCIAEIMSEIGTKLTSLNDDELKELLKEKHAMKREDDETIEQVILLIKIKRALKIIQQETALFDEKGDLEKRAQVKLDDKLTKMITTSIGKDKKIHKKKISEIALELFKKGYNEKSISLSLIPLINDIART
ncbi:MAG: hypothetical protein ACXQS8_08495 [Candidatus Helarchaeales archaeon]